MPDDSPPIESTPDVPDTVCANLDAISADIAESSPTPNEAAIAAEAAKTAEAVARHAHLRDVDGNTFDPAIHVTDSDGEPKLSGKGKLRKRPGRKAGVTAKRHSSKKAAEDNTALNRQHARMSGAAAANSLIMLGVVVGGDEWNPRKDVETGLDEREVLQCAFGDYFELKNLQDIPPGVALATAVIAYVTPRLAMPKTQTRLQRCKEWVFSKIAKRRARRATQSNTRDDGKRQNDTRESTG